MVIGVAAGVACYLGATALKHAFGYDDALDCFGVHAVGGAIGAILTGVFAIEQYGGTKGLIEGNAGQVLNQFVGVVTVIAYDAVVTSIIVFVVKVVIGLRVSTTSSAMASTSPCTARPFSSQHPRRPSRRRVFVSSRDLDASQASFFCVSTAKDLRSH